MKHRNVIVVPVGSPIDRFVKLHNLPFDIRQHWRQAANPRNYDIIAIQYGDFVPEPGTYDELVKRRGGKWELAKWIGNERNLSEYEYIGFYDDDVIVDTDTVVRSFDEAALEGVPAFQISLAPGSESAWPSTQQVQGWHSSKTNFIEIMCPVFKREYYEKFKSLINSYPVRHGWGIDIVLSDYFASPLTVYHFGSMYHPSRPQTGSSYGKNEAMEEMKMFFHEVYPRFNPLWQREPERIFGHRVLEK